MSRKLTLTLIGALIAALVLLVGVYAVQRSGEADQVPDGVTAAGIDIGGLTRSEVEAEILSYEDSLAGTPASFLIDGTSVILDPASVGFDLQEGEVADAALDANEQRSFFSGLLAWLGISTSTIEIDVPATLDQVAIEKQLAAWEAELQADDSVLGGVAIRQGTPVALYATPVERIERQPALETITAVLADPNRPVVTLQTETRHGRHGGRGRRVGTQPPRRPHHPDERRACGVGDPHRVRTPPSLQIGDDARPPRRHDHARPRRPRRALLLGP